MALTGRGRRAVLAMAAAIAAMPARAQGLMGPETAACTAGNAPAIEVHVSGLKDRTGDVRLELYPADEADFLKDDHDLLAQGKVFRRIVATPPAIGAVTLCIRVPRPGTYALFFVHNRDGRNKFNFWSDGAGVVGSARIGRARPKLSEALVTVGAHPASVSIRAQYLRGLGGFGPLNGDG